MVKQLNSPDFILKMVGLKTKTHQRLREYLAQQELQSLQGTLKINDNGNKLVKLLHRTNRLKEIHFLHIKMAFFWTSFHNRNSWKYTDENENDRSFSGEKIALFLWGFLFDWGFLCGGFVVCGFCFFLTLSLSCLSCQCG